MTNAPKPAIVATAASALSLKVYLGTHLPNWITKPELAGVPLFISHLRLRERKTLPAGATDWVLDSGGFTCITQYGRYLDSPAEYVAKVRRYADEMGRMTGCAIQDHMCEPIALARTGKTIAEHHELTVQSAIELNRLAPELPWLYVLQGFACEDYLRCLDLYRAAGVDTSARVFGLGSVCRRQNTAEVAEIVARLEQEGVRLHLFGFKRQGFERVANMPNVASSDSLAWSYAGRKSGPCPESANINCANCLHYALNWYEETLQQIEENRHTPRQLGMERLWN